MFDYTTGSVIEYIANTGEYRTVTVDNKDDNIKDGRSGFDGVVIGGPDDGMGVWGYDTQIIRVISNPEAGA